MSNINTCLNVLTEETKTFVKIKGSKNANGEDLYTMYGKWFEDAFPKGSPITGIIWGRSMDQLKETGISVIFAQIKNGKVIKEFGQKNSFKSNQIEEIK